MDINEAENINGPILGQGCQVAWVESGDMSYRSTCAESVDHGPPTKNIRVSLRSSKYDPKTGLKICVGDAFYLRGGPLRKKVTNKLCRFRAWCLYKNSCKYK